MIIQIYMFITYTHTYTAQQSLRQWRFKP